MPRLQTKQYAARKRKLITHKHTGIAKPKYLGQTTKHACEPDPSVNKMTADDDYVCKHCKKPIIAIWVPKHETTNT